MQPPKSPCVWRFWKPSAANANSRAKTRWWACTRLLGVDFWKFSVSRYPACGFQKFEFLPKRELKRARWAFTLHKNTQGNERVKSPLPHIPHQPFLMGCPGTFCFFGRFFCSLTLFTIISENLLSCIPAWHANVWDMWDCFPSQERMLKKGGVFQHKIFYCNAN